MSLKGQRSYSRSGKSWSRFGLDLGKTIKQQKQIDSFMHRNIQILVYFTLFLYSENKHSPLPFLPLKVKKMKN